MHLMKMVTPKQLIRGMKLVAEERSIYVIVGFALATLQQLNSRRKSQQIIFCPAEVFVLA